MDITNNIIYLSLRGAGFSPSRFTEETGISLRKAVETGSLGLRGKYKNQPLQFGYGSIDLENFYTGEVNAEEELFEMLLFFKKLGADGQKLLNIDQVSVWVVVYDYDTAYWEVSPRNLLLMGELGYTFCFSGYELGP